MCGIVGYVGGRACREVLLSGLKRLEYRGYDSAGVALGGNEGLVLRRAVGSVENLRAALDADPADRSHCLGIAHTRWATHGRPTEANAHPHLDVRGRIALVHNGIIENHAALRAFLEKEGITFRSETDTEALAQLIGYFYHEEPNLEEAVRQALGEVHGAFGIAAICSDDPDTLVVARRGSPLIVGVGDGEYIVASDAAPLVEHTGQVIYLKDHEMAVLRSTGHAFSTIDAEPVEKRVEALELTLEEIELGHHDHYMAKEIEEQPEALRRCFAGRIDAREGRVTLGGLRPLEQILPSVRRLQLFGCGTAWHAALVGEYLFEELVRIPTEVDYASELRYRNPIVEEGTLAIVLSQSGETADSLAALRELRLKGARTFGIVNTPGSTIAREVDAGAYLHAGPEIGVASTKAFTCQVAVLTLLAVDFARRRHLSQERTLEVLRELEALPAKVEQVLQTQGMAREIAAKHVHRDNWLYLGRGVNYPVALEGALKLKEISYIHAEGMPAAEMKHGPIALIDEGMPVVFVAPQDHNYDKVLANIEEVNGRGGRTIAVATEGDDVLPGLVDHTIFIPRTLPLLSPILSTIPLQFLAYHAALLRGHNVDKPRNLAKSVTVE